MYLEDQLGVPLPPPFNLHFIANKQCVLLWESIWGLIVKVSNWNLGLLWKGHTNIIQLVEMACT